MVNETNKDIRPDHFDHDLKMLNYFQNEFYYRHKHYWNLTIKACAFSMSVSTLPLTTGVFGFSTESLPVWLLYYFPAFGLIVALFSAYMLYGEAKRMTAVNDAKRRINAHMEELYHYVSYQTKKKRPAEYIAFSMVAIIFFLELIVALSVGWVIAKM